MTLRLRRVKPKALFTDWSPLYFTGTSWRKGSPGILFIHPSAFGEISQYSLLLTIAKGSEPHSRSHSLDIKKCV